MKKVKKEEPSPKKKRKSEEDEYSPAKVCVHTVDPVPLSHCIIRSSVFNSYIFRQFI